MVSQAFLFSYIISMAFSIIASVTIFPGLVSNSTYRLSHFPDFNPKLIRARHGIRQSSLIRATADQLSVQAPSITYAREMERASAKQSLLLAINDCGGFSSLVTGNTTDLQRIDVNERIIALEKLNPTSRPTASSLFDGRWNFEWFGSSSSGFFHSRLILEKFPSTIANMTKMYISIKDGSCAEITAFLSLFNSMIKGQFIISSKLSVEGQSRMKEEYTECLLETPEIDENVLPQHVRGAFDQAISSLQQLTPQTVKDAIANGLKLPLSGSYKRLFLISYLDEEILIIRDNSGLAEVLIRLDEAPPPFPEVVVIDDES